MASTVTKKNSLCRYFIRYGDCFHGENCQFIHAHPPQSSPQPQQTPMEPPPTPIPQVLVAPQPPPAPQQQGYNMNKLVCSFKSDLPNEIDFAMQVATLLANTDNFTWFKDYLLVDAICSSLHVYTCVCGHISACYCYPKFWHKLFSKKSCNQYLQAATVPPDMEQSFMNFELLVEHDLKDHSKIYKRIKTAAELMKQFSMTTGVSRNEKNDQIIHNYHQIKKKKLKASPSLLKFVSLLLHCDDAQLNLIGLDILSNTASKLSKIPDSTNDITCMKLVQMFQEYCVDNISCQDGDIYIVNRSIEVVSRLISSSSRTVSSSIINLITEKNLVLRVEQFLTSHYDVTLFLSALECCYRISRHQPHLLTTGRTRYLLKILLNLLNCDDSRYFTPNALKRIKLVDEEELTIHHLTPLTVKKMIPTSNSSNTNSNNTNNSNTTNTNSTNTNSTNTNTTNTNITNTNNTNTNSANTNSANTNSTNTNSTNTNNTNNTNSNNTNSNTAKPSLKVQSQPQVQQQEQTKPPSPTPPIKEYTCEWNNCNAKFLEPKQVYTHVFETHIGPLAAETQSPCLWSSLTGSGPGCVTKRPKYSLLTHLNDFHCNQVALERSLNRSQPIKPPEHPGYAPNAALLAIRRHANATADATKGGLLNLQNQSPLSISVRLTAALILRNLATESPEMKQALENHEPLLSEICMSNGRDEAKIIAECLSLFSKD